MDLTGNFSEAVEAKSREPICSSGRCDGQNGWEYTESRIVVVEGENGGGDAGAMAEEEGETKWIDVITDEDSTSDIFPSPAWKEMEGVAVAKPVYLFSAPRPVAVHEASVLVQRLSFPTETVLSKKIILNMY